MNLYLKFFTLLIKRIVNPLRQQMTEPCLSGFRVSLFDMDLNFHMNNGRFFTIMDLGRFDLLMRTGYFFKLFRNGYYPVILSESIVFKRSLGFFEKYDLQTQVDSWDKNFYYITQKFMIKDEMVAAANVRACFKRRGKRGIISTKDIFRFVGEEHEESRLSELALKQVELDNIQIPRKKIKKDSLKV